MLTKLLSLLIRVRQKSPSYIQKSLYVCTQKRPRHVHSKEPHICSQIFCHLLQGCAFFFLVARHRETVGVPRLLLCAALTLATLCLPLFFFGSPLTRAHLKSQCHLCNSQIGPTFTLKRARHTLIRAHTYALKRDLGMYTQKSLPKEPVPPL